MGKIEYLAKSEVIKNFILVKVNKAFELQLKGKPSNIISTDYSCLEFNTFKFFYLLNRAIS